MAIFNFEMLQCCVITGTGCHRGHHISGLTACCAIVYMGAAILEQQEQQEKVAYKESFPTTCASLLIQGCICTCYVILSLDISSFL